VLKSIFEALFNDLSVHDTMDIAIVAISKGPKKAREEDEPFSCKFITFVLLPFRPFPPKFTVLIHKEKLRQRH
jgi:hypothetical protein